MVRVVAITIMIAVGLYLSAFLNLSWYIWVPVSVLIYSIVPMAWGLFLGILDQRTYEQEFKRIAMTLFAKASVGIPDDVFAAGIDAFDDDGRELITGELDRRNRLRRWGYMTGRIMRPIMVVIDALAYIGMVGTGLIMIIGIASIIVFAIWGPTRFGIH
jgi:hypothetical protein